MAKDLMRMLTEITPTQQPVAVPGTPGFRGMFGQQQAQRLQGSLGSLARGGAPSAQARMGQALAGLDLNKPEDLAKLAKIQQGTGDFAGAAKTAAKIKALRTEEAQASISGKQSRAFSSYVANTFKNPELTKLAAEGVLTSSNLDDFIQDTSNATFLKGSTFTVRDSEGNNFTMMPTLNNKSGKLENKYSPLGDAPEEPIGATTITGGEFAETADEKTRREIEKKGLSTQESKFQELKVAATDSIPTLNASKANLDRATALLDSVTTGGPITLIGTGLENFFGTKGASKAELEIILGQEMFKSLKPLFGGVISEGERESIVAIYANLRKGNVANKGILKRLKQELEDGLVKARMYQKADNYEEYNMAVKQMFPETSDVDETQVIDLSSLPED